MKSRPILFSAPMVRALLAGTKTQTRRIVKPQPEWRGDLLCWDWGPKTGRGYGWKSEQEMMLAMPAISGHGQFSYGMPGDRLWVRECAYYDYGDKLPKVKPDNFDPLALYYRADGECCEQIPECCCAEVGKPRWTPSIHMPRWASRITLEITGVRVERLQGISEADARAEGLTFVGDGGTRYGIPGMAATWNNDPRECYRALWESINGPGSWARNEWVWVVEFKRVEP